MKTQKMIYVVDDETDICKLVCMELERYGHTARPYHNGTQAYYALKQHKPDLLIVDLGLPDMDGLNLVRKLSGYCETGVIILSGRNTMADRVLGLELGADDYLPKPYSFSELLARIEVLARRRGGRNEETVYRVGDLELDRLSHRVTRGKDEVVLQPRLLAASRSPARCPDWSSRSLFRSASRLPRIRNSSFSKP